MKSKLDSVVKDSSDTKGFDITSFSRRVGAFILKSLKWILLIVGYLGILFCFALFFKLVLKLKNPIVVALIIIFGLGILSLFYITKYLWNKKSIKIQEMNHEYFGLKPKEYEFYENCPLCKSDLSRSKVDLTDRGYIQVIKCKNPFCLFAKEFKFKE